MLLVMFFVGMVTGLLLGMGVTVIWYDDEKFNEIFKDDNDGQK